MAEVTPLLKEDGEPFKVAVLIPTINNADELDIVLERLSKQTYTDFEIVISGFKKVISFTGFSKIVLECIFFFCNEQIINSSSFNGPIFSINLVEEFAIILIFFLVILTSPFIFPILMINESFKSLFKSEIPYTFILFLSLLYNDKTIGLKTFFAT